MRASRNRGTSSLAGESSTHPTTVGRIVVTDPVVGFECEHDRDDPMALEMLHALTNAYPGHSWYVKITGGIVHIKNLDFSDKWGMALHYSQLKDDAQARKRGLILAGGEFLERAHMRRGEKTETVTSIEGVPQKHLGRVGL